VHPAMGMIDHHSLYAQNAAPRKPFVMIQQYNIDIERLYLGVLQLLQWVYLIANMKLNTQRVYIPNSAIQL